MNMRVPRRSVDMIVFDITDDIIMIINMSTFASRRSVVNARLCQVTWYYKEHDWVKAHIFLLQGMWHLANVS